ncbi:endonuclease/exonuclease/phosphatase family protein [Xanthobacter aminoxidans]|uniref:endonuclease/exonuclease/phosphatase family protein n=1 Tax=Xanthobacter aminoxidans TaxID=186280 RepID=UPI00372A524D
MYLRLLTWNMNKGFARKSGHVTSLQPDIAILQEVRKECLHKTGLLPNAVWMGREGHHGLAAVAFGNWRINPVPIAVSENWFMPLVASNGTTSFQIVAVQVSAKGRYVPAALNAIAQLSDFIRTEPTLIAGDFNGSVKFPRKPPFGDVLAALGDLGLHSAWHGSMGEAHGQESRATYYRYLRAYEPSHIDYVFHPASLPVERITIGSFEASIKISDHAPIVVDFSV